MKAGIQILKLGLAALLLAMPTHSLFAGPPQTGIRGQVLFYYPGFAVEVEPGVWLGEAGFTMPMPGSFTILSAHSNRNLGHFATDAGGAFEVSLPPGKYVFMPDTLFGLAPTQGSFEVTVTAKHYTEVVVYYVSSPIEIVLPPGWPNIPLTSSR